MDGEFRRQQILKEIQQSGTPVSGKKLAGKYSVSRQVIVQDIAILRAAGNDIVSTCRGYVCQKSSYARRTIQVRHTDDEIMEELNVIVDFGGTAEDVYIHHKVYGTLRAALGIPHEKAGAGFCGKDPKRTVQSAEKCDKRETFSHDQCGDRRGT